MVEHDERRPQLLRARKIEDDGSIFCRSCYRLEFGEGLQAALRLTRGVCLVAPAIHICLQLLGLRFLRGARGFRLRLARGALRDEGVIVAWVKR